MEIIAIVKKSGNKINMQIWKHFTLISYKLKEILKEKNICFNFKKGKIYRWVYKKYKT